MQTMILFPFLVTLFIDHLAKPKLQLVLTKDDQQNCPCAHSFCDDPYLVFSRISSMLDHSKSFHPEIHPTAIIHDDAIVPKSCNIQAGAFIAEGASLGDSVYIGANSVIEKNVQIGDNSWIAPNVTIMNNCVIGNRASYTQVLSLVAMVLDFQKMKNNHGRKYRKLDLLSLEMMLKLAQIQP